MWPISITSGAIAGTPSAVRASRIQRTDFGRRVYFASGSGAFAKPRCEVFSDVGIRVERAGIRQIIGQLDIAVSEFVGVARWFGGIFFVVAPFGRVSLNESCFAHEAAFRQSSYKKEMSASQTR